jgi:hypothetical protein
MTKTLASISTVGDFFCDVVWKISTLTYITTLQYVSALNVHNTNLLNTIFKLQFLPHRKHTETLL